MSDIRDLKDDMERNGEGTPTLESLQTQIKKLKKVLKIILEKLETRNF